LQFHKFSRNEIRYFLISFQGPLLKTVLRESEPYNFVLTFELGHILAKVGPNQKKTSNMLEHIGITFLLEETSITVENSSCMVYCPINLHPITFDV
jgi:hypothetical protein